MRTADTIKTAYTAADMLGNTEGLTLTESVDMVEVRRDDYTGKYTAEWTLYVSTNVKRQVARVYIPATGEDYAVDQYTAQSIVMGLLDPTNPNR